MKPSCRLMLCASVALTRMAAAQQPIERLFYYVDGEQSYNSLVKHIDQISVLAPQAYTVDSLGIVWGASIAACSRWRNNTA